jgi:hypothetical protein
VEEEVHGIRGEQVPRGSRPSGSFQHPDNPAVKPIASTALLDDFNQEVTVGFVLWSINSDGEERRPAHGLEVGSGGEVYGRRCLDWSAHVVWFLGMM